MAPLQLWAGALLSAWTVLAAPYAQPQYPAEPPTDSTPTVKIQNGTLEGVRSPQYNQDFFLGIPFAQPPVGPLRFNVPRALNQSWEEPRPAKEYSASCVGYGSDQWPYPSLSEDCLYLNVVRPSGHDGKLPVAFWIHGGGLTQGSGIDQRYNLSFIVQRSVDIGKPIMAVSINYRLSMWGFLHGEEVIKSGNANLGFKDQRLAMHWVQENIEAFGGDPSQVTVFGESAGALSIGMHLTAYGGRNDNLFRAAIMQSGAPINYGTFANYNPNQFLQAAASLGCGNASSKLDCLRTIDYATLNAYINSTAGENAFRWSPVIDGDFIHGKTSIQVDNGDFVKVPIISGANSDEGTAFGPKPMASEAQFYQTLTTPGSMVLLTPEQATKVLDAYPANITYGAVPTNLPLSYIPPPEFGAASRRSDAFFGDLTFVANRRKTCQSWSAAGVPVYCYRFNTIPNGIDPEIGATHFQEVAFVFNNQLGVGYGYPGVSEKPLEGMPESYFALAETMSEAWIRFVATGNPGDYWPEYDEENWVFDANVTELGYVEKDDWRKKGIELINKWDSDVLGR